MNEFRPSDEPMLARIDRLLEQGRPVEDPLLNKLAGARPEPTPGFQQALERRLLSHLQNEPEEKNSVNASFTKRRIWSPSATMALPALVAAAAMVLVAVVMLRFGPVHMPASGAGQAIQPITQPVVVAAQPIPAGTTLTEDMLAVVTLSEADRQALQRDAPERVLIGDRQSLVGQTAAADIRWFQPIEQALLGEPCAAEDCFTLPEGYSVVGVPLPTDGAQGLPIGARVDVLSAVDGTIRVMAADVMLASITPEFAMLAALEWKVPVLVELFRRDASVALRLHTGLEKPPRDETPVEYTFIAPEALPEDYRFGLIVNVPVGRGDLLVGLPYAIDNIQVTSDGEYVRFWFTNIEVVSITRGTAVLVRLPQSDAANLDLLIDLGMELTFVPEGVSGRRKADG